MDIESLLTFKVFFHTSDGSHVLMASEVQISTNVIAGWTVAMTTPPKRMQ